LIKRNLSLNIDTESYLECEDLNMMKKCTVPLSHFKDLKSGYFNIYHLNHENNSIIYYGSPLIEVTLSKDEFIELYIKDEDNDKSMEIGLKGIINIVLNYTDNEVNIFPY